MRFRYRDHTFCEVVSTRGPEACVALDIHFTRDSVSWYDQTGRGRMFALADIVLDEPDELRFVSSQGFSYRVVPMTIERWKTRVLPMLGPAYSQWIPSGTSELDVLQLEEHVRSLAHV